MKEEEKVKIILKKVIENYISLDEFYALCEDEWENYPLLNAIIDNIESLLEHSSDKEYKSMKEYRIMLYDLNLLENLTNTNHTFLFAKRELDIKKL